MFSDDPGPSPLLKGMLRCVQDQFADLEESYGDHTAKVWREVALGVGGEHAAAS